MSVRQNGACASVHRLLNTSAVCDSIAQCDAETLCRVCSVAWRWIQIGACVCDGACETEVAVAQRTAAAAQRSAIDTAARDARDGVWLWVTVHFVAFWLIGVAAAQLDCFRGRLRVLLTAPLVPLTVWSVRAVRVYGWWAMPWVATATVVQSMVTWAMYTSSQPEVYILACDPPDDEMAVCAVCLDRAGEWGRLKKCGHRYHIACVENWIGAGRKCPVCRN